MASRAASGSRRVRPQSGRPLRRFPVRGVAAAASRSLAAVSRPVQGRRRRCGRFGRHRRLGASGRSFRVRADRFRGRMRLLRLHPGVRRAGGGQAIRPVAKGVTQRRADAVLLQQQLALVGIADLVQTAQGPPVVLEGVRWLSRYLSPFSCLCRLIHRPVFLFRVQPYGPGR